MRKYVLRTSTRTRNAQPINPDSSDSQTRWFMSVNFEGKKNKNHTDHLWFDGRR